MQIISQVNPEDEGLGLVLGFDGLQPSGLLHEPSFPRMEYIQGNVFIRTGKYPTVFHIFGYCYSIASLFSEPISEKLWKLGRGEVEDENVHGK